MQMDNENWKYRSKAKYRNVDRPTINMRPYNIRIYQNLSPAPYENDLFLCAWNNIVTGWILDIIQSYLDRNYAQVNLDVNEPQRLIRRVRE